ncbi:hypothetical protein [Chitinophaga nivalis]|uniref:Peptidase S8/S53 domain-containing protein n=1 Tax=Chitinophaga nivalis TaxID=2991709 RepID=A0ABT3IIR2_9BACT|nr:hypothetical protein [Chitinophaga nivalis]MCW3466670.1 hypothetical protein [Chitinophaga nivalis]MCW3483639.1 hypothetical protein [Chitinophaga nivalis]
MNISIQPDKISGSFTAYQSGTSAAGPLSSLMPIIYNSFPSRPVRRLFGINYFTINQGADISKNGSIP